MAWKGSRYWLIFFLGGICSGFIFPVWTPSLLNKCVNQIQQGHLVTAEKIARASQELTSGAEARTHFQDLAARLNVVPFPTPRKREFFRARIPP
jgi:hypothetical protein